MTETVVVSCDGCGANNRVILGRVGVRCGKCGRAISTVDVAQALISDIADKVENLRRPPRKE